MAKEYTVLKADELVRPGDLGRLDKYYRVSIKTAGGMTLSVDVSASDWTPDRVRPLLTAAAEQADKILRGA